MIVWMMLACVGSKEPIDTALPDTDTDTDRLGDDTATPMDTASALEPPRTFLGDVGFVFTDMAVRATYACAVTAQGRVFCWSKDTHDECQQPSRSLRASEVTVPRYGEASACALDSVTGEAVCWSPDGVASWHPGPFQTISGNCGILTDGSLDCWEPFDMCPRSPPTTGSYVALDAREYGTAVRDDGAIVAWSGPCVEWGGSYDKPDCLRCPDRLEVAGPFVAVSNVQRGGVCAAYAGGGVYCDALDASLVTEAPASGTFVDIDSYSWWADGGACALDADGVTTCWGDDVASATVFVDIESSGKDAVYGLTPSGTIEEFDAAYPEEWIPCDPAVE